MVSNPGRWSISGAGGVLMLSMIALSGAFLLVIAWRLALPTTRPHRGWTVFWWIVALSFFGISGTFLMVLVASGQLQSLLWPVLAAVFGVWAASIARRSRRPARAA